MSLKHIIDASSKQGTPSKKSKAGSRTCSNTHSTRDKASPHQHRRSPQQPGRLVPQSFPLSMEGTASDQEDMGNETQLVNGSLPGYEGDGEETQAVTAVPLSIDPDKTQVEELLDVKLVTGTPAIASSPSPAQAMSVIQQHMGILNEFFKANPDLHTLQDQISDHLTTIVQQHECITQQDTLHQKLIKDLQIVCVELKAVNGNQAIELRQLEEAHQALNYSKKNAQGLSLQKNQALEKAEALEEKLDHVKDKLGECVLLHKTDCAVIAELVCQHQAELVTIDKVRLALGELVHQREVGCNNINTIKPFVMSL